MGPPPNLRASFCSKRINLIVQECKGPIDSHLQQRVARDGRSHVGHDSALSPRP